MQYKLNADGWLFALGASLAMLIAAAMAIAVYGIGPGNGIWAGIALIAVITTYKKFMKEIK